MFFKTFTKHAFSFTYVFFCILHPLDSHVSSSFASSWSVFGKQAVGGRSALCIFYMQIAILACVGVSAPFCRQVWQELCKVHVFHKAIQKLNFHHISGFQYFHHCFDLK